MDGRLEMRGQTPSLADFLAELGRHGFSGDVETGADSRAVYATDNSVYELAPRAVLFPRVPSDLNIVMHVARGMRMPLAPRGGGTGTNGQSLSDQIIVDCSRHLTKIEEIDPIARTATVQPGVILDQLNEAAAEYGLFFGPTVSTAPQATLGGMVATDASGKGSRVFGRTSDHILAMDVVFSDGSDFTAGSVGPADLVALCARDDIAGRAHRVMRDICLRDKDEIERVFPIMNRGLTGYNLKDMSRNDGGLSLTRLLAGSEGTLALTKRITLRLLPRNSHKALMVVAYDDGLDALADAQRLTSAEPTAVEFIDDKILKLAQDDDVWTDIAPILNVTQERPVMGLNFIEVQAEDSAALETAMARLTALGATNPSSVLSAKLVADPHVIAQIWALRAKCVGLLGRMDPTRQGTPFVEDAAVPVENLRDFVAGFREILDGQGLAYGMFGHADVGCVHVRPALDMRREGDARMIRVVSDAVEALARRHGGVIWGEHGKGFRGEYVPGVFGPRLYAALCQIKAAFDPENLLNPGKIAAPDPDTALAAIDAVSFRGPKDAAIAAPDLAGFEKAVKCNGNGQCFNQSQTDAMCPSYKVTRDRRYAPKGRAALLREWLRLKGQGDATALAAAEAALHQSLGLCLSCKACSARCPLKVDIPDMKALFYNEYYRTRTRPLRHRLAAMVEPMGPVMRRIPWLSNFSLTLFAPAMSATGLVALPRVRPPERAASLAKPVAGTGNGRRVLLVEDSFNAIFDGTVIEAAVRLLSELGCTVTRLSNVENGKAKAVLGYTEAFEKTARARFDILNAVADEYDALIELEPAVAAMAQSEYEKLGLTCARLQSIDHFLAEHIRSGAAVPQILRGSDAEPVSLIAHCTERAQDPHVNQRWAAIFAAFGIPLDTIDTGCCGMAGIFGHEKANQTVSKGLFERHWAAHVARSGAMLATGFSCRSQVKRFANTRAPHPVEFLAKACIAPHPRVPPEATP